ncbi:hypothetical protein D3C71_2157360 [compost metagenome]
MISEFHFSVTAFLMLISLIVVAESGKVAPGKVYNLIPADSAAAIASLAALAALFHFAGLTV